jgi:hypothetical protein
VLTNVKNMLQWVWNTAVSVLKLAADVLKLVKKWQQPFNNLASPVQQGWLL